jgi:uncharacterized protein (TIGR02444 family)
LVLLPLRSIYSMDCIDVMDRNSPARNKKARNKPRAAPDRVINGAEAFWRFSLGLYARPGTADALIALQDRAGLDVNLILFGLWVGARHGRELGRDGLAAAAEAVAELNANVRTIRALRRELTDTDDDDIRRLRSAVLRLELFAERQVQRRLAASFAARTPPHASADRHSAALANLALCLGDERESPEAAILRREFAALTRRT